MEAGAPQPHTPSSPAPPSEPDAEAPGRAWRVLGVALALALAFASAVMIVVMLDIGGTPRCDDPAALAEEREETGAVVIECFDASQLQKVLGLAFGWPAGVVAAIAALLALFFAVTGRRGQLMIRLTGAAIVLGGLSILIGSI